MKYLFVLLLVGCIDKGFPGDSDVEPLSNQMAAASCVPREDTTFDLPIDGYLIKMSAVFQIDGVDEVHDWENSEQIESTVYYLCPSATIPATEESPDNLGNVIFYYWAA